MAGPYEITKLDGTRSAASLPGDTLPIQPSYNELLEQQVELRTRQLRRTNRALELQSHENELFVYTVSHDLRSPLVNLQGFSKVLENAIGDLAKLLDDSRVPDDIRRRGQELIVEDVQESIQFIQSAVSRLSGIIDALLRLSRVGRVELQTGRIEVQDIVNRVVESLSGTISDRAAKAVVGVLPPAFGDAQAVEQVFANLIGNALNYLDPQRPGTVEIGCTHTQTEIEEGIPSRTYFVRDNGMGVDAAHFPQLFQVFKRLRPEIAPGEGMGLAIVRRIVERHGGQAWVESTVDEGSTFYFSLPAMPLPDLPLADQETSTTGPVFDNQRTTDGGSTSGR